MTAFDFMNETSSSCSVCGRPLQYSVGGAYCPHCAATGRQHESATVTGPPVTAPSIPGAASHSSWTDLLSGVGIWIASLIFMLVLPLAGLVIYGLFQPALFSEIAKGQMTPRAVLISLVATFVAQMLTLALAWGVVTRAGQRPFLSTMGWFWRSWFKVPHAIALTIVMLGVGWLTTKFLPHKETSLDKVLEMGLAVRVTMAVLATLGAPIVEEVVYRGVLYPAIERTVNSSVAVVVVTLLFWSVHLAQYWNSAAVLVSVFVLSLALTLVRAATGSLLPCVVTHFLFNGIQAIGIIMAPEAAKHAPEPARAALTALLSLCGLQ